MTAIIDKHLPGETQLVPSSPIRDLLDGLRAHVDAGGTLTQANSLELLKTAEFLFQDRNDCREDARNRRDRLDQIRRLA